jgi:hypothetical protein
MCRWVGVNNGCKILNSARIKLPSAGSVFPTGKKEGIFNARVMVN